MKLILAIASIPFYIWIFVAGLWGYFTYTGWKTETFQPMVSSLESLKTEYTGLKLGNDKAEAFKREREERFRRIQDLELQFKATADRIPRSANIPEILRDLADISDRAGLEFYHFKPNYEKEDAFLRITPVDVMLKGSYPQVMSFLDETAHLKRIVAAKSLEFSNPETRGGVSVVSAQVTIFAYRIESEVEAAKRIAGKSTEASSKSSVKK